MTMRFLTVAIIFVGTFTMVLGQEMLHTSEGALQALNKEQQSLKYMNEIINEVDVLYDDLNHLIKSMNMDGSLIREDVEKFLQNPLNQLHLMDRYADEWNRIEGILQEIKTKKSLMSLLRPLHWTTTQRSEGLRFLRFLADVYDLDVANFSRGVVAGIKASGGGKLTADECTTIAVKAYENGKYSQCAEWMEEAYWRIKGGEQSSLSLATVAKDTLTCRKMNNQPDSFDFQLYKTLCQRQENYALTRNTLQCYLKYDDKHPWTRFSSAKVEPVSVRPNITLYHGLIPKTDIDYIKTKTHQILLETNVTAADTQIFPFSTKTDELGQFLKRTQRRLLLIEGLSLENSHSIAVEHNPRQFSTTFDPSTSYYVIKPKDFNLMIYLSDVEYGGATVFLSPSAAIVPSAGTALIWEDGLAVAECPVLYGDYWTAILKKKVPEYNLFQKPKYELWDLDGDDDDDLDGEDEDDYFDWNDDFDWLKDIRKRRSLFDI